MTILCEIACRIYYFTALFSQVIMLSKGSMFCVIGPPDDVKMSSLKKNCKSYDAECNQPSNDNIVHILFSSRALRIVISNDNFNLNSQVLEADIGTWLCDRTA